MKQKRCCKGKKQKKRQHGGFLFGKPGDGGLLDRAINEIARRHEQKVKKGGWGGWASNALKSQWRKKQKGYGWWAKNASANDRRRWKNLWVGTPWQKSQKGGFIDDIANFFENL